MAVKIFSSDEERVLGDFDVEMARRNRNARKALLWKSGNYFGGFAVLWFAIQPLGLDGIHQLAFFGALIWLLITAEDSSMRLADDVDLLEAKIVKELNKIDKASDSIEQESGR